MLAQAGTSRRVQPRSCARSREAAETIGRGPIQPPSPVEASRRVVSSARPTASRGDVVQTPVSPKDILATTYHLLGIDPATIHHDRLGRPLPVAGDGKVWQELIA
jgi:hypothetical protein